MGPSNPSSGVTACGIRFWISGITSFGPQSTGTRYWRVTSGFSITMDNASDYVKSEATDTTDNYSDEGFAKAIERFILGGLEA